MKRFFSDLKIKQKIQVFAIGALLLLCVIFLLFYGCEIQLRSCSKTSFVR